MRTLYILITCLFIKGSFLMAQDKELRTIVLDPELQTVQLYPYNQSQNYSTLSPAVFTLGSTSSGVLEFDDLLASYRQFHVKIVHCNVDWTPSVLRELEYLNEYNDFIINNYEVSQGTKIQYFHYGFRLPEIKMSGNYVLQLYENSLSDAMLAQIRFKVLDPQVAVMATVQRPQDPGVWRTHQQVNFEINYGNYQIRDPRTEFIIQIRQNFRDETTKTGFTASSLNAARQTLSYKFFNNENLFPAGNEFRYVDIRSTYTSGNNIEETLQGYEDRVLLKIQQSRANRTYLDAADLNGRFIVETLEDQHPSISGDYIHLDVSFSSLILAPNQSLCILGGFNQFNCQNSAKMKFSNEFGGYTTELLLKQGIYDFQFAVMEPGKPLDFSFFEGNFTDTGNSYEIMVYHKPPAARSERLVGYALIEDSRRSNN